MDHVTSTTDESTPSTSKLGNRASITASILRAQLEAIERNKKILYSTYVFKKDSPLQPYIKKKINENNNQTCLATILNQLKIIIEREGLYDSRNKSIILCSEELDRAINMRALHVSEIREQVLSHLHLVKESSIPPFDLPPSNYAASARIRNSASIISNPDDFNMDKQYHLKIKFRICLEAVPAFNREQTSFSIPQVSTLLSQYILMKKNELFDPRNIKLALVMNDPLGEAFGVSAFHRTQVPSLVRTQLIPCHCTQVQSLVRTQLIPVIHLADDAEKGTKRSTRTTPAAPSPPRTRNRIRDAAGPAARTRNRKTL